MGSVISPLLPACTEAPSACLKRVEVALRLRMMMRRGKRTTCLAGGQLSPSTMLEYGALSRSKQVRTSRLMQPSARPCCRVRSSIVFFGFVHLAREGLFVQKSSECRCCTDRVR